MFNGSFSYRYLILCKLTFKPKQYFYFYIVGYVIDSVHHKFSTQRDVESKKAPLTQIYENMAISSLYC